MSNRNDKNKLNSGEPQTGSAVGNPEPSLKQCNHCG